MATHHIVLIPGDGIGPEVTRAVQRILKAAGADIVWLERLAGLAALEQHDEVLPQSTLDAIREKGVALKGPCTTPVGEGFTSVNVALRQKLNLYAAIRPVRNLDGIPTRFSGVDIVVVRENTEGLYSGAETEVTPGVVTSLKVATDLGCTRIAQWAFDYAKRRNRRHVTVFHKANIMKMTDGMFRRCAREVHDNEFPEMDFRELIIDAGCMRLVQDPSQFDVLLLENLYGDVVSDLCAGMVGGLGVIPGANIGKECAIFEAVHGSAPDIAGQANPLALLMSAVMMLNHLAEEHDDADCRECAGRIKAAYNQALADDKKTRDLGGDLNTDEFTDAVIERMSET